MKISFVTQSTAVPKGNVAKEVQVLTKFFFRYRKFLHGAGRSNEYFSFASVSSRNELAKYSHT
jgi:hypothetical protein